MSIPIKLNISLVGGVCDRLLQLCKLFLGGGPFYGVAINVLGSICKALFLSDITRNFGVGRKGFVK